MTYRAVDCQGFAGGFTLGMVQAGFELVGKKEMHGGFGVPNCEANRHLLGGRWEADVCDPEAWTPVAADVVFGNPPCSGFSLMSHKDFRGVDSPVNACMWAFAEFVGRTMPYIGVFESVQQAFTGGLPLMRALREKLEADTGCEWALHHVLHNCASVGGAAIRKRYFWLVSRVPFGIEEPAVRRVPTVADVLLDLEGLGDTWLRQPYRRPASWWSEHLRSADGAVDGHKTHHTLGNRRALELIPGADWHHGEVLAVVARRHWERHRALPDTWSSEMVEKLLSNDWQLGFHQAKRWDPTRVCRVVTGAALSAVVHPTEDRFITQRETARIQGFPDDWRIEPLRGRSQLGLTWGKGIPVTVGRWIGGWVKRALDGEPGGLVGEQIGEREYKIDVTNTYRRVCTER